MATVNIRLGNIKGLFVVYGTVKYRNICDDEKTLLNVEKHKCNRTFFAIFMVLLGDDIN